MIEIAVGIAFFLLCLAVFILLPILLVIRAAQLLFGPAVKEVQEVRETNWRHADAFERERMVRKATGWRVIGRVASAGALAVGAVVFAPLPVVPMWLMAGYRLLKPIPKELREACTYQSTGTRDEPRYSGDVDAL